MLAPRCGRALQAGLFVRRRDNLRLLCAWWAKGSAGVPHPTVGQGVRAGWACLDNACTSVWACTPSVLVL
uniref:Uncharacterized protein n=1 Tax=Cucumis melo TaxID=3656 RepID=A0A9I9E1V7_CUCME